MRLTAKVDYALRAGIEGGSGEFPVTEAVVHLRQITHCRVGGCACIHAAVVGGVYRQAERVRSGASELPQSDMITRAARIGPIPAFCDGQQRVFAGQAIAVKFVQNQSHHRGDGFDLPGKALWRCGVAALPILDAGMIGAGRIGHALAQALQHLRRGGGRRRRQRREEIVVQP